MIRKLVVRLFKMFLPTNFVLWIQKYRVIGRLLYLNYYGNKQGILKTPWVCMLPFDPKASVEYINEVYNDYFIHSGIPYSYIKGKRVLEIGPGENLGVGMRFLAEGASLVVSVDRFRSLRNYLDQEAVYQQLINKMSEKEREQFGDCITFSDHGYRLDEKRYLYLANKAIEDITIKSFPEKFNLIVSRAVLEHVSNIEAAFNIMDSLLFSGGYMVHEVDFRDHGIFSGYGMNPLTFLSINDHLWKAMSSKTGAPNRKIKGTYVTLLEKYNYKYRIINKLVVGSNKKNQKADITLGIDYQRSSLDFVKEIRKNLATEFKNIPDEELLVAGIIISAQKLKP